MSIIVNNPIEWAILCAFVFFVSGMYAEYLIGWFRNSTFKCEDCKDFFYYHATDMQQQAGFIMCNACWSKEVTSEYELGCKHTIQNKRGTLGSPFTKTRRNK